MEKATEWEGRVIFNLSLVYDRLVLLMADFTRILFICRRQSVFSNGAKDRDEMSCR